MVGEEGHDVLHHRARQGLVEHGPALVLHVGARRGDHAVEARLGDVVPDLGDGPSCAQEHLMAVAPGSANRRSGTLGNEPAFVQVGPVDIKEDGFGRHLVLAGETRDVEGEVDDLIRCDGFLQAKLEEGLDPLGAHVRLRERRPDGGDEGLGVLDQLLVLVDAHEEVAQVGDEAGGIDALGVEGAGRSVASSTANTCWKSSVIWKVRARLSVANMALTKCRAIGTASSAGRSTPVRSGPVPPRCGPPAARWDRGGRPQRAGGTRWRCAAVRA